MSAPFPKTVQGHPRWSQVSDWVYKHESEIFRISRSLSFDEVEGVDAAITKGGHWIYDAWHGASTGESMAVAINAKSVHSFDDAVAVVTAYAKQLKSTQQSAANTEGVTQP